MDNTIDNKQLASILGSQGSAAGQAADQAKKNNLDQEAFLKLLITQVKHQDPLNPQDPQQFLGDMAQFASVKGITDLNTSVADLKGTFQSHRALQASSMVGRNVRVESEIGFLPKNESLNAVIDLPVNVEDLKVEVIDLASRKVVDTVSLGKTDKGAIDFSWNGVPKDADKQVSEGRYGLLAKATAFGKEVRFPTLVDTSVSSVVLDKNNGFVLNLKGIGPVAYENITEIDSNL